MLMRETEVRKSESRAPEQEIIDLNRGIASKIPNEGLRAKIIIDKKDAEPVDPERESESRNILVPTVTAKAVIMATFPKVIAELDRIGELIKRTDKSVRWTKIGIVVAVALFLIGVILQHFWV